MTKPSTDTETERAIAEYRADGDIPARMTLRFVALLTKKELAQFARFYNTLKDQKALPAVPDPRRRYRARYERIQSERRQRGHIKG